MNILRLIKSNNYGFTLIESLLSIALLGLIVSVSVPFLQSFQIKNDLDITINIFVENVRNAQIYARAIKEDHAWGIKVNVENIVLFKGDDYLSRDTNFDEVFDISSSIVISGDDEIIFNKFTGFPNNTHNFTFTSSEGINKNLLINEKGTIIY